MQTEVDLELARLEQERIERDAQMAEDTKAMSIEVWPFSLAQYQRNNLTYLFVFTFVGSETTRPGASTCARQDAGATCGAQTQ